MDPMSSPPVHMPISVHIYISNAFGTSYTEARFKIMIQWLPLDSTKTNHLNPTTIQQTKNLQSNKQIQIQPTHKTTQNSTKQPYLTPQQTPHVTLQPNPTTQYKHPPDLANIKEDIILKSFQLQKSVILMWWLLTGLFWCYLFMQLSLWAWSPHPTP